MIMHRDELKSKEYFFRFVSRRQEGVDGALQRIKDGLVPEERIPIVMRGIGASKLRILIAKYSGGFLISEIEREYLNLLGSFSDYWLEGQVLMKYNGRELKQYLDYDDMLWMLSLGVLFKATKDEYAVLLELIRRDQVKDKVYEFFISNKLGYSNYCGEESYEFGWDLYRSLRSAIDNTDSKEIQAQLIHKALEKDWVKDHREILKSSSGRHDTYYGAWSFESAAITAILDLDDSRFKDNKYYPKDLVDYYREKGMVNV
jgi:hypothetical protein